VEKPKMDAIQFLIEQEARMQQGDNSTTVAAPAPGVMA